MTPGVAFFLDCVPPTVNHQSGRVLTVRPMFSKKKNRMVNVPRLADSRELAVAKLQLEKLLHPHRLAVPMVGPVAVTLEFTWPWLASHSRRVRAAGRIPKVTRPDCSNTAKTFEDRLVALQFIEDDGPVCELITRKWHGDRPGISVRITPFVDSPLFGTAVPAAGEERV